MQKLHCVKVCLFRKLFIGRLIEFRQCGRTTVILKANIRLFPFYHAITSGRMPFSGTLCFCMSGPLQIGFSLSPASLNYFCIFYRAAFLAASCSTQQILIIDSRQRIQTDQFQFDFRMLHALLRR